MPCACGHEQQHDQLVTHHGHLADQHKHHELATDNTLHVIGVVSNPRRWQSRYRLAREWFARMEATPHVRPYLVEATLGDRKPEVSDLYNQCTPKYLQLHTNSEIWIKENMLNLGKQHLLPPDARYICWCDTDLTFREPAWALETLHQLQHYPVVQPWQQAMDLGPDGDVMKLFASFGYVLQRFGGDSSKLRASQKDPLYQYAHTGFAWACTRAWWERVAGLVDFAILGSADYHMAWGMVGEIERAIPDGVAPGYRRRLMEWGSRAALASNHEVGYVKGRIEHAFHGAKSKRNYKGRWEILIQNGYDPDTDLMYDDQGVIQLTGPRKIKLEQAIRRYNEARSEDSIDR